MESDWSDSHSIRAPGRLDMTAKKNNYPVENQTPVYILQHIT